MCDKLPRYKVVEPGKDIPFKWFLSQKDFEDQVDEFVKVHSSGAFNEKSAWLSGKAPNERFFNLSEYYNENNLFVQKLILKPGVEVAGVGEASPVADLHGDIHSLCQYIEIRIKEGKLDDNLKIQDKENFYMVFLGDYSDRGWYGLEVLYLIMQIKKMNPDNVFLLRGNHESEDQNIVLQDRYFFQDGEPTLGYEIQEKFGLKGLDKIKFYREMVVTMQNLMAAALFLGFPDEKNNIQYVLFCHGSIDPRFDLRKLLTDKRMSLFQRVDSSQLTLDWAEKISAKGKEFVKELHEIEAEKCTILEEVGSEYSGFVWNDNTWDSDQKGFIDRSLVLSKSLIHSFLSFLREQGCSIKTIITAHQHGGEMYDKMCEHWGMFNSWAPESEQWDGEKKELKIREVCPLWTLLLAPYWSEDFGFFVKFLL